MKKVLMLFFTCLLALVSVSQKVKIEKMVVSITPVIGNHSVQNVQQIKFKLKLSGVTPVADTTINFELQPFNLPNSPLLTTPSIVIPRDKWESIPRRGGFIIMDTVLNLRTSAIDSLTQDEIGHILIHDQPEYIELRLTKTGMPQPAAHSSASPVANSAAPANKLSYIHLDNKESKISPIYKKDSSEPRIITMFLIRDSLATKNDTVNLAIEQLQFPFKPKMQNQIAISKSDWVLGADSITDNKADKLKYYYQADLIFKNISTDSLTDDLIGYVKIEDGDKSYHALRLTERGWFDNKSFWVDMGANFNLFDNIKANNFYAGIFMFEKDVCGNLSRWRAKGGKRISFTGGVYETKSLEVNAVSDSGLVYRDGRSYIFNNAQGGYPVFRDTGKVTTNSTISNLGIFFSPHFRLNKLGTNENGFHWYISFYTEMLWQRISTTFVYDNTKLAQTYFTANKDSLYKIPFKEFTKTQDYRTQYLGLGFPFYIKEKNFSLYINNILGFTNQKYQILQNNVVTDSTVIKNYKTSDFTTLTGFAQPRHSWNPFVLCQFRLNDERIGITFTGEVRTLLLKNVKPLITLTLSKKFDLSVLYNAITKPFTGIP